MSEGLFLFLLATAVAFVIPAIEQPGWNVRRWAYGALAIVCLLAIPLWGPVGGLFPKAAALIKQIPESPSAWFTLVMVLFIVSLAPLRKPKAKAEPEVNPPDELKRYMEAKFTGITTGMEGIWRAINENAKAAAEEVAALKQAPKRQSGINWTPWKLMDTYQLGAFSRILCGRDPNGASNNESEAFVEVLKQDADSGKLKSNRRRDPYSHEFRATTWETEISKKDAIGWAKEKGLDVSHIE